MKRTLWRAASAATAAISLVLGGAVAAHAVPTPDLGPDAGGTTVTVPAPEFTFTQISKGVDHTLAIGSNGNTYAWGANGQGQLGNATNTHSRTVPVQVQTPAGVNFVKVSAGHQYSIAIGDDGLTYSWGSGGWGRLGDGTTVNRNVPGLVDLSAFPGVSFTDVSAGTGHVLAIGDDGNTYAWGWGESGALGNASNISLEFLPVRVDTSGLGGVVFTSVSASKSMFANVNHSAALDASGNAYAWGVGTSGSLGNGANSNSNVPVLVAGGHTFTEIATGTQSTVAIGADGKTYAWGLNDYGQLGDGTNLNRNVPVETLTGGVSFAQISVGGETVLAKDAAGNLYSWGRDYVGGLGDGSGAVINGTPSSTPVSVVVPAGVVPMQSANWSGGEFIGEDGGIYYWGFGAFAAGVSNYDVATLMFTPVVAVTGITFDGIAGTSLTDNGDGTYDVVTPAHLAGPVDVVVEWTLNGVAQDPITYTDGFTYYSPAAATVTDPADQSVTVGDPAVFTVTATGTPDATVTWEVSSDGGTTWVAVTAGVSTDGLTLTVDPTTAADSGNQYRATATNGVGTPAVSAPATLTVNPVPAPPVLPTVTNPTDQTVATGGTATFTVATTGNPTVVWQVSRDGGLTWQSITVDPAATPSASGLTLSVVGSATNSGYLYRAVATNSDGSVTSTAAKLTVTPVNSGGGTGGSSTPAKGDEVNKTLSHTGVETTPLFWIAGLTALLLGGGLIAGNRIVNRRFTSE